MWAADAHDAGPRGLGPMWAGQLKMWAADAHDAGPCGLGSCKGGQLMLMMLARVGWAVENVGS